MLDTVEKQQVLEASEFFADVPAFLRESILSSARLRSFACRDLMFVVDGPRNETLLLMKGCAKIAQFTKDGKEIALRLAVPGELVSELGSGPGSLESTTALAFFECEALAWPTETFDALLRFPILQRNVEKHSPAAHQGDGRPHLSRHQPRGRTPRGFRIGSLVEVNGSE